MRDELRRRFGLVPLPSDTDQSRVGDPPDAAPEPSNIVLNAIIVDAVSFVNRRVRWGKSAAPCDFTVSAAQTVDGPYTFDLEGGLPNAPAGALMTVRQVWWVPTSGNSSMMTPVDFLSLGRKRRNWLNESPGTPDEYWEEGMQLSAIPGPDATGSFRVYAGLGALAPQTDAQGIKGLLDDHVGVILDAACVEYFGRQEGDQVARDRLGYYSPKMLLGIKDIDRWVADKVAPLMRSVTYRSNRLGFRRFV